MMSVQNMDYAGTEMDMSLNCDHLQSNGCLVLPEPYLVIIPERHEISATFLDVGNCID